MANIIDLTEKDAFKIRKLERLVKRSLYHHNPDVLALWKELVVSSIKKYPGVPCPETFEILLSQPASETLMDELSQNLQGYLQRYIDDVKKNMLEMLGEIILLQKEVAESRVKAGDF